ncbi:MAG TPA: hypothetical protein VK705_07055 [Ferruginibacter sp.]|jgi:hypothetical protein|nr:hypothetical protein [Ferruginibacter sp.]
MKQKIFAILTTLPVPFIALADSSTTEPTLSSRSGFIISGIVASSVILLIALASGPNKKIDNEHDKP